MFIMPPNAPQRNPTNYIAKQMEQAGRPGDGRQLQNDANTLYHVAGHASKVGQSFQDGVTLKTPRTPAERAEKAYVADYLASTGRGLNVRDRNGNAQFIFPVAVMRPGERAMQTWTRESSPARVPPPPPPLVLL